MEAGGQEAPKAVLVSSPAIVAKRMGGAAMLCRATKRHGRDDQSPEKLRGRTCW